TTIAKDSNCRHFVLTTFFTMTAVAISISATRSHTGFSSVDFLFCMLTRARSKLCAGCTVNLTGNICQRSCPRDTRRCDGITKRCPDRAAILVLRDTTPSQAARQVHAVGRQLRLQMGPAERVIREVHTT